MGESQPPARAQIDGDEILVERVGEATNSDATEVVAPWETSSQYWKKHQATIEKMFAPLTRALIAAADIQPGQSVLDIGGGSGEPSLTLSAVVGESGRVTYTDPAAGMVQTARHEAERRGLSNIAFHQSPAEGLPFPDNTFDIVVGRLSAMFFVEPESALREILRVTKPGGRIAFLVWGSRDANPFFSVIGDVLNQFVPCEVVDEDAASAFRFARPGKLVKVFTDAGAIEVTEEILSFRIADSLDMEGFWTLRAEMSGTVRGKLAQLDSKQVADAKSAIAKTVAEYFKGGHMSFPAQALIVTGRKR